MNTPHAQEQLSWFRQNLRNIRWKIHATFPNSIHSPYNDDRNYFINRARQANEETRVPQNDELRHRAVWAIEIFGPAEIESFYQQINKLGWNEPQTHHMGKSLIDTIKEWRIYGITGNFNIGVVNPNKNSGYQHTYVGPVPKDVEYLLVNVVQFTPELTCLIVGFVLKEEVTKVYESALNEDRKFEHRAKLGKFIYTTWGPELLKRESIDKERLRCRNIASSWMKDYFRGFFYSSSLGKRLPLVELITCTNELILTHHNEPECSPWARLLLPNSWGDVWASTDYPGFRIRRSDSGDDMPFDSIVCLQTSTIPNDDYFRIRGGITPGSLVAYVHESIDDFICQSAVLHMLHEIARLMKNGRETLKISGTRYKKIIKSIDEVKLFFDRSIGFPTILGEVHSKAEIEGLYTRGHRFMSHPWAEQGEEENLSDTIRQYTEALSKRIIDDDSATREHFEQVVSILSTREGVKTQRRMEILTYVTIIVSVVSIIVALGSLAVSLSPDEWIKDVKTYVIKKTSQLVKTK